jgi:dsRNA-specific ribonuclease
LYFYICAGGLSSIAATVLAAGSFATAKVDRVLGTHIGEKLEHIQPNKKDDDIEKDIKEYLHKLGERTVHEEAKK